jgi:hypothetical protein
MGKRPVKPRTAKHLGLSAEMWKSIGKCWSANPSRRPTIDEVVKVWEGFVNRYVIASFGSSAFEADVLHLGTTVTLQFQSHRDADPSLRNPPTHTPRNTVSHPSHEPSGSCAKLLESGAPAAQDAVLLSFITSQCTGVVPVHVYFIYLISVSGFGFGSPIRFLL